MLADCEKCKEEKECKVCKRRNRMLAARGKELGKLKKKHADLTASVKKKDGEILALKIEL